jgi:hypothetical protein
MTDHTQGSITPPAQPVATDAATLQMLIQLLLAERQDALLEKQEKARTLKLRDDQRRINAQYSEAEKIKIQQMCTHKKGGKGLKSPKTDYAVYFHTFTDASSYIRCQICGMKWRNKDTDEVLLRRGKQTPNHTGIGWKKAWAMIQESTNTASASEVQINTQPIQTDTAQME